MLNIYKLSCIGGRELKRDAAGPARRPMGPAAPGHAVFNGAFGAVIKEMVNGKVISFPIHDPVHQTRAL